MTENFIYILTFLYGIGGIIMVLGYYPTIKDLWHKKASANIQTYSIWTLALIVASMYGFLVLKDPAFILVTNLNLLSCVIILGLGLRLKFLRKKHHEKK